MKTLLERAKEVKKVPGKNVPTKDEIELAVAWASGEVTLSQVATALKTARSGSNIYVHLAIALRAYIQQQV